MREREKQLIEKCQTGRPEHFAELYDAYVKKIYAFVYYRVSHRETAEDLTSEVFIKALDKIKHYSSDQGLFHLGFTRLLVTRSLITIVKIKMKVILIIYLVFYREMIVRKKWLLVCD